jgi:hypothetical protein
MHYATIDPAPDSCRECANPPSPVALSCFTNDHLGAPECAINGSFDGVSEIRYELM